jgi:hypothetical protein
VFPDGEPRVIEEKRVEGELTAKKLSSWLQDLLPRQMIPSAFVRLDFLPHLPSGKIDVIALPKPDYGAAESREEHTPPRTEEERVVAAIFAELLRVELIGVHDDFFVLGGHSLLATQALSRVRKAFHANISLQSFFERPSVAGVVLSVVEERARHADAGELERLLAEVEALEKSEALGD